MGGRSLAAIAVVALGASALAAFAQVGPTAGDRPVVNPAVLESEREWERQRRQQSVGGDRGLESAEDRIWERRQQNPDG